MKRAIPGILAVGLLLIGATPTPAGPLDQRIVAAAFEYLPAEVTLTQGDLLEFTNLDVAPHDVMALDDGPDGKPLFSSNTISAGNTVPVERVDKLRPGVYDFTCTLHPSMLGTLFIESSGG